MEKKAVVVLELDDRLTSKLKEIEARFRELDKSIKSSFSTDIIRQFNNETSKTGKIFSSLKSSVEELQSKLFNLGTAITGLTAGFSFGALIKQGMEFTDTVDRARLQIATSILLTGDLYKEGQKVINQTERWNTALQLAEKVIKRLQIYNLRTTATFKEMVENFSQILPYITSAGAGLEKASEFAFLLMNAVKSLGLQTYQVVSETRALLTGEQLIHSQIAQVLGLTKQQIELWKQQGVLVDKIIEKLKAYDLASKEIANTLSGSLSNLQDTIDYIAGIGFEPLTRYFVKSINDVIDGLITIKNNTVEVNQTIISKFQQISYTIIGVAEKIKDLSRSFQEFINTTILGRLAELHMKILMLTAGFVAFAKVVKVATGVLKFFTNKIFITATALYTLYKSITNIPQSLKAWKGVFWELSTWINSILVNIISSLEKLTASIPIAGEKLSEGFKIVKETLLENIKISEAEGKKYKKDTINFFNDAINDISSGIRKVLSKVGIKEEEINKLLKIPNKINIETDMKFQPKGNILVETETGNLEKKIDIKFEILDNEYLNIGRKYAEQIKQLNELRKKGLIETYEYEYLLSEARKKFYTEYKKLLEEESRTKLEKQLAELSLEAKKNEILLSGIEKLQKQKKIYNEMLSVIQKELSITTNETDKIQLLEKELQLKEKIIEINNKIKEQQGSFIEGFRTKLKDASKEIFSFYKAGEDVFTRLKTIFEDTLSNAIFDAFTGKIKSLKDYLKSFLNSIAQFVSQLIAKLIVIKSMEAIASKFNFGGEVKGYNYGGFIKANTGRYLEGGIYGKDSIPVLAKAGEFVVRKEAVDFYGLDFIKKINNLEYKPEGKTILNKVFQTKLEQKTVQEVKNVNINMNIQTLNPIEFEQYLRETNIIQKLLTEDIEENGITINTIRRNL